MPATREGATFILLIDQIKVEGRSQKRKKKGISRIDKVPRAILAAAVL